VRTRASVAALVVMAMVGGCSTYAGSRTTAKVGGGVMAATLVVIGVGYAIHKPNLFGHSEYPTDGLVLGGSFLVLPIAMTVTASSLLGMLVHDRPARDRVLDAASAPTPAAPPAALPDAQPTPPATPPGATP